MKKNKFQNVLNGYLVVFSVGILISASGGSALELVKDGQACATIVVADDAGAYQKWAAQWLQEYVQKATAAQLPIIAESNAPAGTLISVGHTRMARQAGIKTDDLKYDGCKLLVKGSVLYLLGRDDVPFWDKYPSPRDSAAQGTIRAVTTFLEDIAGVRWFLPGPEGIFIPVIKDITVPDNFSKTFIPAIAYGSVDYDTPIASYANNSRKAMKAQLYGGHSWYFHVPAREDTGYELLKNFGDTNYFKDHPEYFRMDENGKRTATGGHLCTSNPDVRKIMVAKVSALFTNGYDAVELGQSDGWLACLCPECMKMDGHRDGATVTPDNPCEKVWSMHKWIIDELGKKHPDKKVMVIIYGPTGWPSKKYATLPENAIGEMAPITPERIAAWHGKVKYLSIYTYWWEEGCNPTCFLPPFSPEAMQNTIRMYRDLGVIGITAGPRVCWGLGGPLFYAYAKLLGNPDLDMDTLLNEYYQGVYGEAGRVMERFFKLLHSRSGQTWNIARFPNSYPEEDAFSTVYPPAVVAQLDRLLKKAEDMAVSERSRNWVKHTRDCFDGLKTIADMFAAKRAFDLEPKREMLLLVKARVESFEQWRSRILGYFPDKDYIARWFPAYETLCGALISGGDIRKYDPYYYSPDLVRKDLATIAKGEKSARGAGIGSSLGHNEIAEPITWDFERMLANLGRPQEDKKMTARCLSGQPDAKEWEKTPAVTLTPYLAPNSSPKPNRETFVRLLYDNANLYVRYECREPNLDNLKLKSVGQDGNVYSLDEVELLLNPECSNRKMMHFMASPVKDARYDERKGYIDDPLDPRYSAEDIIWNTEWAYTYKINQEKKTWILDMAVPFKSLGSGTPKPGAVWMANFARCRRADGGEELSSWIPETFGSNPDLFGELVFADKSGKIKEKPKQQSQADPLEKGELTSTKFEKVGRGGPARLGEAWAEPSDEDRLTQPSSRRSGAMPSREGGRVRPTIEKRNLIANGGFETPDENGNPKGWRLESYLVPKDSAFLKYCAFSGNNPHNGAVSLKADYRDIGGYTGSCSQIILDYSLDPEAVNQARGKEVILSAWLYYEYLDENCQGLYYPGPIIALRVGSRDKDITDKKIPHILLNHSSLVSFGIAGAAQATGRWCHVQKKGKIPPEAESVIVRIEQVAGAGEKRTERNATALFLDDVSLELAESPPVATKP